MELPPGPAACPQRRSPTDSSNSTEVEDSGSIPDLTEDPRFKSSAEDLPEDQDGGQVYEDLPFSGPHRPRSSSLLLALIRGLPRLMSLSLRSCGFHVESYPSLGHQPACCWPKDQGGILPPHQGSYQGPTPGSSLPPTVIRNGKEGCSNHSSNVSAATEALPRRADKCSCMSCPCPSPASVACPHSAQQDGAQNGAWLAFDDEVAVAASLSPWSSTLGHMQLIGFDMEGLTEVLKMRAGVFQFLFLLFYS